MGKYKIITSMGADRVGMSIHDFEKLVNDMLAKGYKPLGGIAINSDRTFYQAIYKPE